MTINLGTDYGSDEFIRRYTAAVKGERLPQGGAAQRASQAPHSGPSLMQGQHSLNELIVEWYKSAQYTQLGDTTKRNYRLVAERLREEHGHRAVEDITRGVVKRLMATKADKPAAANMILRLLCLFLDHAMDSLEWIETNPARGVKKYASKSSTGFHAWDEAEIKTYFKRWPIGSGADLAMVLMLYTGAARVDAVQLGPDNLSSDGKRICYQREKMKTRDGVLVDIPVHPELAKRLDRLTPMPKTFLQTEAGQQRSAAGLGNMMRKWCDAAGLSECSAHGLRKACARRLAEAGASPHEIMAVTGHKTLAEVEKYTSTFARAGLADRAMER